MTFTTHSKGAAGASLIAGGQTDMASGAISREIALGGVERLHDIDANGFFYFTTSPAPNRVVIRVRSPDGSRVRDIELEDRISSGVRIDRDGHLKVVAGSRILYTLLPDGEVVDTAEVEGVSSHTFVLTPDRTAWFGTPDFEAPAVAEVAADGSSRLHPPGSVAAIAVGSDGRIFVADRAQHRVYVVHPDGSVEPIAGNGFRGGGGDGGPANEASLGMPDGIAVDAAGNVYIAETASNRIRKVSADGTIATIAGTGMRRGTEVGDGLAVGTPLDRPSDVAVDGRGNIYLLDSPPFRVVRRISVEGRIETLPIGESINHIAVGPDDELYFARRGQVWRWGEDGEIHLVAGVGGFADFTGDGGPALDAKFGWIGSLAVAPDGRVFVADHGNKRIRAIDQAGIVQTVAGNGTWGMFGDGGPAHGASFNCVDLAIAPDGRIFVSDVLNHRVAVIDRWGIIDTYAGTGEPGYANDGGPAREVPLYRPLGVALAGDGSLYIADSSNGRVRRVDPAGIVTTVAGIAGEGPLGDGGPATAARIDRPVSLAVGGYGSLYVAEYGSRRIRRIGAAGVITTIAGDGGPARAVEGAPATEVGLGYPGGLAVRPDGSVVLALPDLGAVSEVRADGSLATLVATEPLGDTGGDGDSSPDDGRPGPIATAPDGALWVADHGGPGLRRISAGRAEAVEVPIDTATLGREETDLSPIPFGSVTAIRFAADGSAIFACDDSGRRIVRLDLVRDQAEDPQ